MSCCLIRVAVLVLGVFGVFLIVTLLGHALTYGGYDEVIPFSFKQLKAVYPISKNRIDIEGDVPKIKKEKPSLWESYIYLKLNYFDWLRFCFWRKRIKKEQKKAAQRKNEEEVIRLLLKDIKNEHEVASFLYEEAKRKICRK